MPISAKPSSRPHARMSRAMRSRSACLDAPLGMNAMLHSAGFTASTMTTAIIEDLHRRLPDAASTVRAGARLATGLRGGIVVALSGELGSGKTTLVRGMLQGLGWTAPVKSPSYALVEHYFASSLYFYHFDFYRFGDPDEWLHTGFAEYFRSDSICVVEWPERVSR